MQIPKEIIDILEKLKSSGFKAYVVGGCVRDLLLALQSKNEGERKVEPKDWDITTNAKPEQIQKIFPKSFYKNKFGTVTVKIEIENEKLKTENDSKTTNQRLEFRTGKSKFKINKSQNQEFAEKFTEVEITPFRTEEKYSDKRHPDKIHWAKTLEEDLARRDFTVNAMALEIKKLKKPNHPTPNKNQPADNTFSITNTGENNPKTTNQKFKFRTDKSKFKNDIEIKIIDLFKSQEDLRNKIIRAVGNPENRFSEDALRMLRAVRFVTTLNFKIEKKTAEAVKKNSFWLKAISKERIKDEFLKIIMAEKAAEGIDLLRRLGLLRYIIPELEEGYKVTQNKHHIYDCYEHSLRSLDYAAKQGFNKYVRIAALLHDIGKPRSKRGEGPDATFYNHEIIGAKMTVQVLNRLRFSKKDIKKIAKLVRYHLFYYNVGEVGESSVRRLVRRVGRENMEELLQVRMADRIGSGVPKAEPYKLRHLKYLIEKTSRDPLSTKMLKVNGNDVMQILKISPGPKIGSILDILLEYVLVDPEKNKKEFLRKEIERLGKLSDEELKKKAQKAKKEREKIEIKKDEMTKKKYWVT